MRRVRMSHRRYPIPLTKNFSRTKEWDLRRVTDQTWHHQIVSPQSTRSKHQTLLVINHFGLDGHNRMWSDLWDFHSREQCPLHLENDTTYDTKTQYQRRLHGTMNLCPRFPSASTRSTTGADKKRAEIQGFGAAWSCSWLPSSLHIIRQ